METFLSRRRYGVPRGFSLIEVAVSMLVLSVGLAAVAALIGRSVGDTTHSRYQAMTASLASEKLEDLNRYPSSDPNVAVAGSSAGSLTSDITNYWDEVQLSSTGGAISITDTGFDSSGNPQYTTYSHSPNGTITKTTASSAPSTSNTLTFHRRWLIEANTPVTGVRRITVFVSLINTSIRPAVTFQMSGVRP